MSVLVVDDARYEGHRSQRYHPERPERLVALRRGLDSGLPPARRRALDPRPATEQEVGRVHHPRYLAHLRAALARGHGQLDPDTYFGPGSEETAWLAAGGVVELTRTLWAGRARHGVALVRPPGHHATPDTAMGFCLLNNVAIAAADLLAAGAARVAVVDWDVHHGNGTQAAFVADPRVLYVSLHEWPFFPGTGRAEEIGEGEGTGRTVNLALPAGSGPPIYGEAFRRVVLPVLEAFEPEAMLVSMGFDGDGRDPLAGMALDERAYAAMTTALLELTGPDGAPLPVAHVLEGGYDLEALERGMAAVARAIDGERTPLPEGTPAPAEHRALERTIELLAPYWPL